MGPGLSKLGRSPLWLELERRVMLGLGGPVSIGMFRTRSTQSVDSCHLGDDELMSLRVGRLSSISPDDQREAVPDTSCRSADLAERSWGGDIDAERIVGVALRKESTLGCACLFHTKPRRVSEGFRVRRSNDTRPRIQKNLGLPTKPIASEK